MITLQVDIEIEDEENVFDFDEDDIQNALDNMFGYKVLKVVAVRMSGKKS